MTNLRVVASLPDEEAPVDWPAVEADTSILAEHVQVADAPVAAFRDDEWPLHALGQRTTLIWHDRRARTRQGKQLVRTWPPLLIPAFKRAAWLLINRPTPQMLLTATGASRRTYPAASTVRHIVADWRALAAWLDNEGVTTLAAVTPDLLNLYSRHLDETLAPSSVQNHRSALVDLWARGSLLPEADRIGEPPFHENGRVHTSGSHGRDENSRLMVSPSTMEPLLAWSLLMLDLAPDIHAAAEEYWRMRETQGLVPVMSRRPKAFRDRVRRLIRDHYPPDTPLPGVEGQGGVKGGIDVAAAYIASAHGVDAQAIRWALTQERPNWRDNLDHSLPLPMPTSPIGRIADTPWREYIDFREVQTLVAHLRTACLIVITYLSGMRSDESRGLRDNCGVAIPAEDGGMDYVISGRIWKGVVNKSGRRDPDGRPHTWQTLKPGYEATLIAAATRRYTWTAADGDYLFQYGGRPVTDPAVGRWIGAFIDWANRQVDLIGLPEQLRIPPCPGGPILLSRFRRTLAWHIRHRPNGHVALAVQYGHMSVEQGEGYSGTKRSGMADLLDEETKAAVASATMAMRDEIIAGGGVSGLGADRALNIAQRTMGLLTAREERELLREKDRAVFDNPKAFALCINDPEKAVCLRGKPKGPPRLMNCVGSSCANLVRTDSTVTEMADEAKRLRTEAAVSPTPLADRLEGVADDFEKEVQAHINTRRTLDQSPETNRGGHE
ncbi:hypothetical protein [Modestobacter roseus]|uniref:hypothetical protein n=1 Tax=Modestobacter roseus TaxID=1181884 RepID=UPI0012959861|nr:hypothetical protein [Modestobacter roseus]MQA35929.1 hypothetical protein [Modestobacter roseus]